MLCLRQWLAFARELKNQASSPVVLEIICRGIRRQVSLRGPECRPRVNSNGYRKESTWREASFETKVPLVEELLQKEDMRRLTCWPFRHRSRVIEVRGDDKGTSPLFGYRIMIS